MIAKFTRLSFKNWAHPIIIPKYKKPIINVTIHILESYFHPKLKKNKTFFNITNRYDLDKSIDI